MLGRILVGLGGVVVAALFAALIAPFFIDWTGFRQEFEDQASRIIGKKVTVHGAVDARFLPFPSVTLHDVRVGTEADGKPLIHVQRFSMDAELAPFLSGEALIFDMRIEDPVARIRLLKDGTLDWMRGTTPSIAASTVVLEKVSVTGGTIDFIDEQSGRSRTITGLTAEMSAKSLAGPWRIEGDAALDGEKGHFMLASSAPDAKADGLALQARIIPDDQPVGAEMEGVLKLVEGKPIYGGSFTALFKGGEAKSAAMPRLKGSFELTNERIHIPDYRMEVGDAADPYVISGEANLDTGKVPQFLLTADGQQIDVNRLNYQGTGGKTDRDPQLSAEKRLEALLAVASSIPVPQVPGRASLKLPAIVANDTAVRDVQLDVRPNGNGWIVDKAVAVLPGRTRVEAKGGLVLGDNPVFEGALLVASSQPSGLSSWLSGKVDPAIRLLKTAGFSADVRLARGNQSFRKLKVILGPARLVGGLTRTVDGKQQPKLSLDLAGNEVDLDVLRGLAAMFGGDGTTGLATHQVTGKIRADRFRGFDLEAQKVDTAFTFSGNALSFERLVVGAVAGAKLTAIGRLETSEDGLSGNGRLTLSAEDPTDLLTLLNNRLPAHPALVRLLDNAGWYRALELKATLAVGGKQGKGLSLKTTGTANGSILNADLAVPDLAHALDLDGVTLAATLENPSVTVLAGQAGLQPLPIDTAGKGVLSLTLEGSGGGKANVAARFTAQKTALALDGQADFAADRFLSGTYKASLEAEDIEPYLILNGVTVPGMGTGLPAHLVATIGVDPKQVAFTDMAGSIGGNGLVGALAVDRAAPGLKANGQLNLDNADLEWLAEYVYGPVRDAEGKLSRAALPSLSDNGLDLTLALTASTFTSQIDGAVDSVTTTLHVQGGQVDLTDISGDWRGGKLTGHVTLGNGQGSGFFQTQLALANAKAELLSWQSGGKPVVTGGLSGKIALEATGGSMDEILRSVGGSGGLELSGATIANLNLDLMTPAVAAADLVKGEINADLIGPIVETTLAAGPLTLEKAAIPFTVSAGKLLVQDVTLATPQGQLAGNVEADLAERRIAASLTATLKPVEDMPGTEPSVTLSFAGLSSTPGRTLDVTALTNYLSLRAFERERVRVEVLQAKVAEKQRLRRELRLYQSKLSARRSQAIQFEEKRLRGFGTERLLAIRAAEQKAREEKAKAEERARAEAEARARAEAEAESGLSPLSPGPVLDLAVPGVPPVTPEQALPGISSDFGLPGVTSPVTPADPDALNTNGVPPEGTSHMPVPAEEQVIRGQPLPPPMP